jgi:hypothetical protein
MSKSKTLSILGTEGICSMLDSPPGYTHTPTELKIKGKEVLWADYLMIIDKLCHASYLTDPMPLHL